MVGSDESALVVIWYHVVRVQIVEVPSYEDERKMRLDKALYCLLLALHGSNQDSVHLLGKENLNRLLFSGVVLVGVLQDDAVVKFTCGPGNPLDECTEERIRYIRNDNPDCSCLV